MLSSNLATTQIKPDVVDPGLCIHHSQANGKLALDTLLAKHVENLNMAGADSNQLIASRRLEKAEGTLTVSGNNCINSEVRHAQGAKTERISLNQAEYAKIACAFAHEDMQAEGFDEDVGE